MRVLHVNNPANVAWGLSNLLRDAGVASHVFDLYPGPYGHSADHRMNARGSVRRVLVTPRAMSLIARYDVVHLHDCDPLAARVARRLVDQRVVLHHHGSLLRSDAAPPAPPGAGEIVATPDLLAFRPDATYLPGPAPALAKAAHPRRAVPVVGHYPSDPTKKGTKEILEAAEPFVRAGRLRLDVATGLTHAQVLARLARCDAVADQWTPAIGAYGMLGLEAMLLGRPILSAARPEWFPGLPLAGLSVEEWFEKVANDAASLPRLGERSRAFALRHHDRARIRRALLGLYGASEAETGLAPAEAAAPALARA